MLTHLTIQHFAVVEHLSLDLHAGMTVLTGETGAGKSILIDAMGLALGDRADSSLVRHGHDKAEITLIFDIRGFTTIAQWLANHELDTEQECLLRRIIYKDGRSRAFINGSPIPLQRLRELGALLIDIHGQHAHHALLDPNTHLQCFDEYAGLTDEVKLLQAHFKQLHLTERTLTALTQQAEDRQLRLDYLDYQLNELERLSPAPGEWEALCQQHKMLAEQEKWLSTTTDIQRLLSEDDHALIDKIRMMTRRLEPLCQYQPLLQSSIEALEQAKAHLDDAHEYLHDAAERACHDPEQLQQIETRIGLFHDLARKHRTNPEQLCQIYAALESEKQQLLQAETALNSLLETKHQQEAVYDKHAELLSKARLAALLRFNQTITAHMQSLSLVGSEFIAELVPTQENKRTATGREQIHFLVRTNPGQPAKPLHKIASGGELSRISLAIEVANTGVRHKPVLIFDEVDVGIGGSTADRVGQYLQTLAKQSQVLCITHLAQVAAHATHHCKLSKNITEGQTATQIVPLTHAEKINEIARMLGGMQVTTKTKQHAEELLQERMVV